MCYSQEASAGFCAMALVMAAILYACGRNYKIITLFLYFASMEALQFLQYGVIDQCDSKWNQLLTLLSWFHICFQPLVVNLFVWHRMHPSPPPLPFKMHRDTVVTAVLMACAAGGAWWALKALPSVVMLIGGRPALDAALSWLPSSTALPLRQLASNEMLCGPRLCSFSGRYHVAWSTLQWPSGYYFPSSNFHAMFFFGPLLLFGNVPLKVLSVAMWLTGPLIADVVTLNHADSYQFEWAAMWCQFSVAQCMLGLIMELVPWWAQWRQQAKARALQGKQYKQYDTMAAVTLPKPATKAE